MLTLTELSNVLDVPFELLASKLSHKAPGNPQKPSSRIPATFVREQLEQNDLLPPKQVVAFINLKGGTGKTTSAVTTAWRCGDYGLRCLLIDIDAQASASFLMAKAHLDQARPFIETWDKPDDVDTSLIRVNPQLNLLPSSLDNSLLDLQLSKPLHQKTAIRNTCDHLFSQGHDLIIIDCPPSLGAGVISAICAADVLVIPTTADSFAVRGINLTLTEAASISATFGLSLPDALILLTHHDRRVRMGDEVLRQLKDDYGTKLVAHPIRTSSSFARAQQQEKSVFEISKARNVQSDYDFFIRTLLRLNPANQQLI